MASSLNGSNNLLKFKVWRCSEPCLKWSCPDYEKGTTLSLYYHYHRTLVTLLSLALPFNCLEAGSPSWYLVYVEIARPLTLRNSRAKHQDWFVLECNTMCIVIRTERRLRRLIVDLSSAPLLWDGLILVQDVRGHVIQVLQSLASHAACHKGHKVSQGKGKKGTAGNCTNISSK